MRQDIVDFINGLTQHDLNKIKVLVSEAEESLKPKRPVMLENIDLTVLKKLLEDYMNDISTNDSNDDDDHYIYKCVMETFYGPKVWDWINENT